MPKTKFKTGYIWENNGIQLMLTNIRVVGTFCYYAVYLKSGMSVMVRNDMVDENGNPLIVGGR